MISIANQVKSLLGQACSSVYYFYPAAWIILPCISWRESGNRELARTDGVERLAEVSYTVDIWSRSPAENAEIASRVDGYLTGARLRREYAADLFEEATGIHHKAMRFRAVVDAAGNIYQ